jgi:ABC-type branched-subunit amino acid transport system substrate-binding protein
MSFKQTRLILGVLLWQFATHVPFAECEEMTAREISVGSVVTTEDGRGQQAIVLRVAAAYFKWLNAEGGIDGQSIKFISYDDGGDPRNTLDLARRLVEKDKVAVLFQMRSSRKRALAPYLRFHGIPSLLNFDDSADTQGASVAEGQAIGAYIALNMPKSKVAIVYEESEFGAAALDGLWKGMGHDNARAVVTNMSGDKAIPGNVVAHVSASSSEVIVLLGGTSFLVRCLKQLADLAWRPTPLMTSAAITVPTSLVPIGTVSLSGRAIFRLTPEQSKEWGRFSENLSTDDLMSDFAVDGYLQASALVSVLKSSVGGSLSSTDSLRPSQRRQREQVMVRFDGHRWQMDADKQAAARHPDIGLSPHGDETCSALRQRGEAHRFGGDLSRAQPDVVVQEDGGRC